MQSKMRNCLQLLLLMIMQLIVLDHLGSCIAQLTVAGQISTLSQEISGMAVNATAEYLHA
jgi:hypothetical protein